MLQEPTNVTHSWERKEGRNSVLRASNGRPLFYLKRQGKKRGGYPLAYFSLSSEDLTRGSAGVHCCSDLPGDAASISPFLATSGSEDTGHAKLV